MNISCSSDSSANGDNMVNSCSSVCWNTLTEVWTVGTYSTDLISGDSSDNCDCSDNRDSSTITACWAKTNSDDNCDLWILHQ